MNQCFIELIFRVELVVTAEGEDEKPIEERIQLPFQPSSYLLSAFFSITKEIHRIGSHTLEKVRAQCTVDLHFVRECSNS